MTALLALLALLAFAYGIHRFAPKSGAETFLLERFRPPGPLTDRSVSHYEEQRRYADLVAIYGRSDVPDPEAGPAPALARTRVRPMANPSCGTVKASFS
ncbi:hypothetical protein [Nocardia sp. NPDC050710]|uniref:hypothetical protein n=1 Tax=Nocardia sp. NPDC050710 TaxID=3157220 RepID=UPI0033D9B71B